MKIISKLVYAIITVIIAYLVLWIKSDQLCHPDDFYTILLSIAGVIITILIALFAFFQFKLYENQNNAISNYKMILLKTNDLEKVINSLSKHVENLETRSSITQNMIDRVNKIHSGNNNITKIEISGILDALLLKTFIIKDNKLLDKDTYELMLVLTNRLSNLNIKGDVPAFMQHIMHNILTNYNHYQKIDHNFDMLIKMVSDILENEDISNNIFSFLSNVKEQINNTLPNL